MNSALPGDSGLTVSGEGETLDFGFSDGLIFELFDFEVGIASEHAGNILEIISGLFAKAYEGRDVVLNDIIVESELEVQYYMFNALLKIFDVVVDAVDKVYEVIEQLLVFFLLVLGNHLGL